MTGQETEDPDSLADPDPRYMTGQPAFGEESESSVNEGAFRAVPPEREEELVDPAAGLYSGMGSYRQEEETEEYSGESDEMSGPVPYSSRRLRTPKERFAAREEQENYTVFDRYGTREESPSSSGTEKEYTSGEESEGSGASQETSSVEYYPAPFTPPKSFREVLMGNIRKNISRFVARIRFRGMDPEEEENSQNENGENG